MKQTTDRSVESASFEDGYRTWTEQANQRFQGFINHIMGHWPEYCAEGLGLGLFMFSACMFSTLLQHPALPFRHLMTPPLFQRALMGLAMGLTAIGLIYSPWGQRSGAHLNPAVTLAFFRLGKVKVHDVVGYITAQFSGGWLGAALASAILGSWLTHPEVNYAVTVPGSGGIGIAFVGEFLISYGLLSAVLALSSRPQIAHLTGVVAGVLVAAYITFESPLSGMSMNPARTTASALVAHQWTAVWIYFTAPILGMLAAAEVHRRHEGIRQVSCAKLYHSPTVRCIFCSSHPLPHDRKDKGP